MLHSGWCSHSTSSQSATAGRLAPGGAKEGSGRASSDTRVVPPNPHHFVESRTHMQRLSGIDPMFIYSDTPETPMEIAYACVFDSSTAEDPSTAEGGYTFERVRDVLLDRIPNLRPFRRRLVTVPFGLDHPRWVDDPDFDLDNHLRRAAIPSPGGPAEFEAMVAAVMGR